MKKKITTAMMIAAMSMSIMACGSTSETDWISVDGSKDTQKITVE